MPILANPKHEAFAQARVTGKTQDEAYRLAGYSANRSNARRLTTFEHIRQRIAELTKPAVERAEVTVDTIAAQLDEDRALAFKNGQSSAAVSASVAKAKLFGLMVEHAQVAVTHNYAMMTEEELRFEIAALNAEARAIKAGVQH